MCIAKASLLFDSRDTEPPRFFAVLVPCSCNFTTEPQIRQGFRASGSLNRVEGLVCGFALRKPPEKLGPTKCREDIVGAGDTRKKYTLCIFRCEYCYSRLYTSVQCVRLSELETATAGRDASWTYRCRQWWGVGSIQTVYFR